MEGTDWIWCFENPKEAAEEIDRLQERVAELERQLRPVAGGTLKPVVREERLSTGATVGFDEDGAIVAIIVTSRGRGC